MMDTWEDFISDVTRIELLKQVKNEAIEEWGSDIPKSLIFSKLGKGISDNFDNFLSSDRDHIFNIIEQGMRSENDNLKTLIATGLLESLYLRASRNVMLGERVHEMLGEKSRQYLLDWGAWSRS
jgi:hypothetical protein